MKALCITVVLLLHSLLSFSQTCDEQIEYLEDNYYGSTYSSPLSTAISQVTFYEATIDYSTVYFAVVCFKSKYSYGCSEYLYQVGSNTKYNYSMNYLDSAGKAFWSYIEPYGDNSPCAPDLD
ncbi:hypothetical protein JCM19275_2219 [Nonlabens ulvanivorans]|uniref:Uncharacterized protein n=1 Tax=Nonlabens ulvanivorans TaxID=906888 RepID=A0A090X3I4_NONUL|nr:hypothetical protein [Nonlabens ulvanivorans]GAL76087.1 hypothetical protein JCM19275_2219 [Nonlabens ulvanivorans]